MCFYMVNIVRRLSQRLSYVVQVKFVLMGRFAVPVGRNVCDVQGRDVVSFLTKKWMTGKRYVH